MHRDEDLCMARCAGQRIATSLLARWRSDNPIRDGWFVMSTTAIRRQYDEVIAANYDRDPQLVIRAALSRALDQLKRSGCLDPAAEPLRVLDVGMGTGLFLERLRSEAPLTLRLFGIDLSERMLDIARQRLPELTAEVNDAARIAEVFDGESFDLICTHFVTGFVPIEVLAPQIFARLSPGGVWSFVGATSAAYPKLRSLSNSFAIRALFGGRGVDLNQLLTPADCDSAVQCFQRCGFEVLAAETFAPQLDFADFAQFMEFAHRGGWLTPFIEELGLNRARPLVRSILNRLVFPLRDHHQIAIATAQRPPERTSL